MGNTSFERFLGGLGVEAFHYRLYFMIFDSYEKVNFFEKNGNFEKKLPSEGEIFSSC